MNDNSSCSQPTHPPQHSQHQQPPQPAEPNYSDVAEHPQESHVRTPLATAYNPQWTISPPPEQGALYTNYNYTPQWQRPLLQYCTLPPVAQPLPHMGHPAVQSDHNPYQSMAGYHQHYIPHAVGCPLPQLPYYPHLHPQQHFHRTTLQHLMPADSQPLVDPNLNRQVLHHVPSHSQLEFKPPPPLAQDTRMYACQNERSSHGDGLKPSNNTQLNVNEEGAIENRRGMSGVGGARGLMSRVQVGIGDSGQSGSHMGSNGGDGRSGQSSNVLHAHGSGVNFRGVGSMQAGGLNRFPNNPEPVTVPVATQFEGAQGFTISGHPIMTNIGMNTGVHNVTTVNHYDGTHGLEKLENFVSFAALHDSSVQDPERRCHPGTRENVLSQIRYWADNPNATDPILWLYGPAGAGKSAITQTIAYGYKQGEVVATFFFFRSDAVRNDGNRLFPTIAWQLAFSIPAAKDFIVYALAKIPHLPTISVETQFEQLVAQVFQPTNNNPSQMPHLAPVVIIDGVDECADEQLQRRILTVIGNAVKDHRVPLRFLISSRPEALIEDTLNQFQDITLRIDLATLDDSSRDIEKYLMDNFSLIVSKQGLAPTWPGQEIIEEIVFKSSGNFILASTLIRFISDEDYSAVSQLDIVRKLKPRGSMSPYALLDELYMEILKQQRDQDFLKTFLALFIGRGSVEYSVVHPERDLHKDDAMLMNVSEQELHIKLRRMRSLLQFKPFIDVYHNKQGGLKRYLELIVNSVVRHVSMAIEQPNCHETCLSSPEFKAIVGKYPPGVLLPVKDWQEALQPLLDLQDKLLKTSKPRPCCVTQIMRELQLHLVILQRSSHDIAATPAPESNNNEAVTEKSPALATEAMQTIREKVLDRCLSVLLSCVQKANSVLTVDMVTVERMFPLLAFDPAEVAARIRSVTDAQKLLDIVDSAINNESFLTQCSRDAARKACLLVSEIFSRVPVLPRSLFLNGPPQQCDWFREYRSCYLEYVCSSAVINKLLGHNYTLPTWFINQGDKLTFVVGDINGQNESLENWLKRESPNFVARIRVMLEVARTIQYVHSMGVVATLGSFMIQSMYFALDSNMRAKIIFLGAFAWQIKEKIIVGSDLTFQSKLSAFADLFYEVCFFGNNEKLPNRLVEDARQLIERCREWKSELTMEDVVNEMERWNLA